MERALKIQKGKESLVLASEIQLEFHGRNPQGVNFICPLCRQPLFPAAMSPGSKQTPHFKHERNNERAHECELYASSYGYFATYQRMPMPMFIRKSRDRNGLYIVEGGFRGLARHDLDTLKREGAEVWIGQKCYKVTDRRFGAGLTKLPIEEVSLNCGSAVRLVGAPASYGLSSTWGYPEDARRAMVFTRDADTEQGKRLKIGDTIPFETDLFLLVPEREGDRIRSSFSCARRVGVAGKRTALFSLSVFEVRLTKDDDRWEKSKSYLEECGFSVDDSGDTPELIWPPSLASGGDLIPLFENARCVFVADMRSSVDNRLYVHTNTDTSDRVKTVPLRGVKNGKSGFAIFQNIAKLSFVTTRNWVFSTAVLLHQSDLNIDKWLHELNYEPQVSLGSGCWVLKLAYPDEIVCYEKHAGIQITRAAEGSALLSFGEGSLDLLQVRRKLSASLDHLVIFERVFDPLPSLEKGASKKPMGRYALPPSLSCDVAFAKARQNGELGHLNDVDRRRAQIRKARSRHE